MSEKGNPQEKFANMRHTRHINHRLPIRDILASHYPSLVTPKGENHDN
jgi:hypothetical protein